MARWVLTACISIVVVEQGLKLGKLPRKAQSPMVRLCLVSELVLAHPIGPKKDQDKTLHKDHVISKPVKLKNVEWLTEPAMTSI